MRLIHTLAAVGVLAIASAPVAAFAQAQTDQGRSGPRIQRVPPDEDTTTPGSVRVPRGNQGTPGAVPRTDEDETRTVPPDTDREPNSPMRRDRGTGTGTGEDTGAGSGSSSGSSGGSTGGAGGSGGGGTGGSGGSN